MFSLPKPQSPILSNTNNSNPTKSLIHIKSIGLGGPIYLRYRWLTATIYLRYSPTQQQPGKKKKQNKNCGLSCDRIETTWKRKSSDQLLHRHTEIATLVFIILKYKQKYNLRVLINFPITHFIPFSLGSLFVTVSLFLCLCLCLFFKSQTGSNNSLNFFWLLLFQDFLQFGDPTTWIWYLATRSLLSLCLSLMHVLIVVNFYHLWLIDYNRFRLLIVWLDLNNPFYMVIYSIY